jgi:acetoin utilization protein AcuC
MLQYDLGLSHPLKPERLRRTVQLLEHYGFRAADPGPGDEADVLRVHAPEYVAAVERLSNSPKSSDGWEYGFGTGDNPVIPGMYEASLAYTAGSAAAARAVSEGAPLGISLSGGLHHAHYAKASGFCVFNDASVAVDILRERFERVAYVDIDVHHGDGVQWMFFDDPTVLTCSIHQGPRTLYPGTGRVDEVGEAFTSLNVPLEPGTTGDTWLWAFERTVIPALKVFKPQAIVLQMGTDAHLLDPLAQIRCTAQEWVAAVERIRDLGIPVVALGGGGYNLTTVPRMWAAACLSLVRHELEGGEVPEPFATDWDMPLFFDEEMPAPRRTGIEHAERAVKWLEHNLLPNIPLG